MRIRSLAVLVPFVLLAACSGGHALAGHWKAETPPAPFTKVGLDIDGGSNAALAHLDTADGHSHPPKGTYTFDAATGAVTVNVKLLGDGKAETWAGKLTGDSLELVGGKDTLKFKKGGSAH